MGTPAFVAPEVVQRSALDGRTDLFSFGATLYFALTGRPPYPARNFVAAAPSSGRWPCRPSLHSGRRRSRGARRAGHVAPVPGARDAATRRVRGHAAPERHRGHRERRAAQRLASVPVDARPGGAGSGDGGAPRPDGVGLRRARRRRARRGRGRRGPLAAARGLRGRGQDARGHHAARERERGSDGEVRGRAGARRAAARGAPGRCARERARVGALEVLFETPRRLRRRAPPEAPGLRRTPTCRGSERQKALSDWVLHVSETNRLAIAIDDAHEIDEPSAALLAVLAQPGAKAIASSWP